MCIRDSPSAWGVQRGARGAHHPALGASKCAPPTWTCNSKQVQLGGCSLVYNDEFSSTLMEQRTLDAIGVLIISTTAGGGVLGRLRCNVDSEGGKYTSATPRCTCLPPRQHCAEVALGAFTTDSSAMLTRREASTPRLRLCVLASLLVNIALKLHSEESKYTSATPRCTCFPPRATSTQVRLVQVQVHLGFASVYLNLDSAYLRGVSGGHLVQLQLKSPSSKSKSPSPTRLRLVGLGDLDLDSGDLSGVGQVHLPPQ